MNTTNIQLGGKDMKFTLIIEPQTGIPMWTTDVDELWCNIVGANLYNYANIHRNRLVASKLDNPKDFAFSTAIQIFHDNMFPGQGALFHDTIFALNDIMTKYNKGIPPKNMYVLFLSKSTGHFVNAAIDGEAILIGARLGKIDSDDNCIVI